MKRTLAVLGLSLFALTANALEVGPPFEQLQIDRALPNLPSQGVQFAERTSAGGTRTDASASGEAAAESPWVNDHRFIAPPQ